MQMAREASRPMCGTMESFLTHQKCGTAGPTIGLYMTAALAMQQPHMIVCAPSLQAARASDKQAAKLQLSRPTTQAQQSTYTTRENDDQQAL